MYKSWQELDEYTKGLVTLLTFSILYINDEVYDYQVRLKEVFLKSGYYRFTGKYLYKRIEKNVNDYNYKLKSIVKDKMIDYASILLEVDEVHQKHISNYYYAVSQCLLNHGITGELNSIQSILSVMDMLCQTSKITIDAFQRNVSDRFDVNNPTREFDASYIDNSVLALSNYLAVKNITIDLNREERILEAFQVFSNKLLSLETINAVINNYETRNKKNR